MLTHRRPPRTESAAQHNPVALIREHPDRAVLAETGFQLAGRYTFPATWTWTPEALIGYAFSTSVLSRAALGDLAPEFAADLRRGLRGCDPGGRFGQTIQFAYDLARRPA